RLHPELLLQQLLVHNQQSKIEPKPTKPSKNTFSYHNSPPFNFVRSFFEKNQSNKLLQKTSLLTFLFSTTPPSALSKSRYININIILPQKIYFFQKDLHFYCFFIVIFNEVRITYFTCSYPFSF
ncbi:MAG: hypothetical protein XD53_0555, partial [Petrotoga mobilis]